MVRVFYTLTVKVVEDMPWIELPGEHGTRQEAAEAAERFRRRLEIKVVRNFVRNTGVS